MIKKLEIVYVVPSRYDDEGYVKRYIWGVVPSNSLAVLKSLTESLAAENPFPGIEISVSSYDDNVEKIPFKKIARLNRRGDTKVVVGLVGVQTGQFPRAADIALEFKKLGVDAMIGGFHVSGVLALFEELTPELQELTDRGVTLICGESETPGVLQSLFQDVLDGNLQPIYRFPKAPDLKEAPLPQVDPSYVDHFGARWATIDSSRGCPYGCTFCTVINIQGRKMRCREADAVLATIRRNHGKGVKNFFFTDDNFARSRIWREVFDGMIEMRKEGLNVGFMMQIDTQSCKIPDFVEKAKAAGCRSVFIGMESVNPANIAAAGKSQNSVEEYREMVGRWQKAEVVVHVGYIIGFPNDTTESIKSDVHFLRDHVGVDLVSFFMMTPLPGSVDHFEMVKRGEAIDPDLNKYDSFHEAFQHPNMPNGQWAEATKIAYTEFYTKDNCTTILRRIARKHYWFMFWSLIWYRYSGVFSGTHPMMTGFFRVKNRLERRSGFKKEGLFQFAWRWVKDFVLDARSYVRLFFEFQEIWFLTRRPEADAILLDVSPEPKTALLRTGDWSKDETQPQPFVLEPLAISGNGAEPPSALKPIAVPNSPGWGFAALADLRRHWNTVQQRVAEYNWSGRCDAAIQEIRRVLAVTAQTLRERSESLIQRPSRSCKKQAIALQQVVSEIEEQLVTIEKNPTDKTVLYRSQHFIRERLIARYEELTHRYVRTRRRVNGWGKDALTKLKKGRVLTLTGQSLFRVPAAACLETYLSLRFSIAALRKEL